MKLEGHASQFLDKGIDDSIAVVAKHFDGKAAAVLSAAIRRLPKAGNCVS